MPLHSLVKTLRYILLIFVCVISHSISATERTDFRVNDDNSTTVQNAPKIAVAIDQTFVITWVDRRFGSGDIFMQKYNSSGQAVGVNQKINDDTIDASQFEPAIALELSGSYSIVWKDYRTGSYPFNPEIFLQRFDSTGTKISSNSQLSIETPQTTRETPDISLNDSKKAVIVWADYRNSNWDIYGQLVASDGSLIGSNFLVNDDVNSAQQHRPRVSFSNDGWFVVTWYDNRFGSDDIFVQVFDSLGNAQGSNVQVSEDTQNYRQAFPDVTTDGRGNFTVVWVDWQNGVYPANPDIYARKFQSDMTPLNSEYHINSDALGSAQREPAISADRLGNVAIIWADSIDNSWDITGQMIDVDGVVREENFKANTDTDSAQVSPDVAIDGKQRYVTWVDRRNGNYDIYASIQQYNDPALALSLNHINFQMEEAGSLPSAQSLIVDHVGYNPIGFTISSNVDWLTITPSTSTTIDTVLVSVNTDTLPTGSYNAILTFRDHTYNDSSLSLPVHLDVFVPNMELSNDTLTFTLFEGVDDTLTQSLSIDNSTYGSFSWSATENISWSYLSTYSGFSDDTISIAITSNGLTVGTYSEQIIFSSADADGSPDTLTLILNIINDLPYLVASPDSVFIYTDSVVGYTVPIVIQNIGADLLNWTVTGSANWITLDTTNGSDNDTLTVSFAPPDYGQYTGYIDIIDSNSFNQSIRVPIILDYYRTSSDSLILTSSNVASLQTVSISLELEAVNSLTEVHLPIQFDTTYVILDSIQEGLTSPDISTLQYSIDNIEGSAMIHMTINQPDTSFNLGNSHLAELFFTSKSLLGSTTIDSLITDSLTVHVGDINGNRYTPQVKAGNITIDFLTDIQDEVSFTLPEKIELAQNYPNPFNLSTIISYSVPNRSEVSLSIFNILGQKVRNLVQSSQSAGQYQVLWNGHYEDGREAPSGIYFYRLEVLSDILVKKMVLLK